MAYGSSGVTPTTLKDGALKALVTLVPALATYPDADLARAIARAEATVCRDLGTRFDVVRFVPYRDAAAPAAPATGAEWEPPQDWPGKIPGDGFPRLKSRIRPLVAVHALTLDIPGAVISKYEVPVAWMRVDRITHEVLIAPSGGSGMYALAFRMGLHTVRLPNTAQMEYSAGLGPDGLVQYPQIVRLVELRAVIEVLSGMSLWLNPTGLSSVSADGLSESRSSGYAFKDIEERLKREADELAEEIRGLWEGPGLFFL